MASRPAVLPETYGGDGSFSDWCDHFESVAQVNGWDNAAKSLWLRVRLVGRAQSAYKRLSEADRADYSKAIPLLKERFEPASQCAMYEAEFHSRRKRPTEDWAAFGEDLKTLSDKAFPDLEVAARERLAVTQFLGQLDPQLSFSVRQTKPKTITTAITATLEMESYRLAPHSSPAYTQLESPPEPAFVNAIHSKQNTMMDMIQKMMARIDSLEKEVKGLREERSSNLPPRQDPTGPVVCKRCGKEGHYARGCAVPRRRDSQQQGNQQQGNE